MASSSHHAGPTILQQHRDAHRSMPFADERDLEAATRGLVATMDPCVVTTDDGRVVWDNDSYGFLDGDAPDTVHPSLWRQSKLAATQGLFEVVEGVYQVRGLDLSNTSFIEGETGVIVIDTLLSAETGAAALALYRQHRGDRPVHAIIYTHSHADHFGGVKGFASQADVDEGRVRIFAPEGFMEHAVSENVFAGTAMNRRAAYMYGAVLPRGAHGQVGAGLGQTISTGEITLIPPTDVVTTTGHEETVDGVRMVFQMAPGTEAPSEMHIWFPDLSALCAAENATHNLHNLLTLRGAVVRDPHGWSQYLTEAIDLFGDEVEVVFASHHWPTWGNEAAVEFLSVQRDLYAYLHDQTLRMLNKGMTGPEIAEAIELPPALENAWHTHGYYGSVSHNVKAIYQRYLGWFDGHPSHLWQHPPAEAARRYVDFMGGADTVVDKARAAYDEGDLRWVAEVVGHVVFAEPEHTGARELLADTYEQLGYGSENGTWRNFFLSGVTELRDANFGTPTVTTSEDVIAQLTPEMLFDALAIQVDGPRAWDETLQVEVDITEGDRYRLRLRNGVLTYTKAPQRSSADLTISLPRHALPLLATGVGDPGALSAAGIVLDGDSSVLARLMSLLDPGDPDFAIVTPD